jgi:hypothetical protein
MKQKKKVGVDSTLFPQCGAWSSKGDINISFSCKDGAPLFKNV